MIPLSVLDVAPVGEGQTGAEALQASLELARLAEAQGYERLWYAEHHNMPSIASTTPEVLVARAGMVTERIRLGSGGVMLPNHAPYKVAETWKMLEALHPGRIDLGLGRAPGTDQLTAAALRRSADAVVQDRFQSELAELLAFGRNEFPGDHPFKAVKAYPDEVPLPPIWLLGSSDYSARLAAAVGMGFSFAAHFSQHPAELPMRAYRERFQPGWFPKPHAILAVTVICAPTAEEADFLACSGDLMWARMRAGDLRRIPTPEEGRDYAYSPFERQVVEAQRRLSFIGAADDVAVRIRELAERTLADEVMVSTIVHDPALRLRSFELLAAAWGALP